MGKAKKTVKAPTPTKNKFEDTPPNLYEIIEQFGELTDDEKQTFINSIDNEILIGSLSKKQFDDVERYEIARNLEIDTPFLCQAYTMQQKENLMFIEENLDRINQRKLEDFLEQFKII